MGAREGAARTIGAMVALLLAAKVWHYWISFVIVGSVVLVLALLGIGYLVKVTANKYPRQ